MEEQLLLQNDDSGQHSANQRDFIKLSDVVAEITVALKSKEKREEFEKNNPRAIKFNEKIDKKSQVFPFVFINGQIDFRTRYKITQYLFVNGTITLEQYRSGLKTLINDFKGTADVAERMVLAKVKRQELLTRPNKESAKADVAALITEFRGIDENGAFVEKKFVNKLQKPIEAAEKAASKAFVKSQKPNITMSRWKAAGRFVEKSSENIFKLTTNIQKYAADVFAEGYECFKQRPRDVRRGMALYALGVGSGIGMIAVGAVSTVVFLFSLTALLPGVFHFLTKPWVHDQKVEGRIDKHRSDDAQGGLHHSHDAHKLVAIKRVVAAVATDSKERSETSVRYNVYDSNLDNQTKCLGGLRFFPSVKPTVVLPASYQGAEKNVANDNNTGKESPRNAK